jgi:CubicO group peptidase (beta-lactamase class C family)
MRTAAVLLLALSALGGCSREPAMEAQGAGAPSPEPVPDHSAFIASVDALVAEALQRGGIAGASVAVFQHDRPILAKGYGHADVAAGRPAAPDTSYPVASVSKLFTAAAVLRLADQGQVRLDDALHAFFPTARPAIGKLTLRQLLSHTSGLTRGGPAPKGAAESVLRRGGTALPPGQRWDYSNYNFSLLGLVVERVSGRSYADYVREAFAAPLGLTNTGYCEDGTAVPGRGVDYEGGRHGPQPTTYWSSPRFFASGGLCSSVLDLVRWQKALDEGRVLGDAGVSSMRAPTRLADGHEADYGYGTRLGWTAGRRKVGHTGGGRSNKAVLARYPDDDVTIAVLVNTEGGAADALIVEGLVARVVLQLGVPVLADFPVTLAQATAYRGTYQRGPDRFHIYRYAGHLRRAIEGSGRPHRTLLHQGEGSFAFSLEYPMDRLVFHVAGDRAVGTSEYYNGVFAEYSSRVR